MVETLQAAGVPVEEVRTYEQNLKKLIAKRIDLMLSDQLMMAYLLTTYPEYQEKITPLSPPIQSTLLGLLISKTRPDHVAIVADFNRGLQEILTDGTFNQLVKKYGFTDELR